MTTPAITLAEAVLARGHHDTEACALAAAYIFLLGALRGAERQAYVAKTECHHLRVRLEAMGEKP